MIKYFSFVSICVAFFLFCQEGGLKNSQMDLQPPSTERTCFQTAASWEPGLDLQSDVAIVYFWFDQEHMKKRVDSWRDQGYTIHVMAAVGRGGENDYVNGQWKDITGKVDAQNHASDIQRNADNQKLTHGSSSQLYYIVPTLEHTEFLKRAVQETIDWGARALHLEEPEFWAHAGYSEAFKNEWQQFYHEPWQDPRSSPEAWMKAAQLKAHLYYRTTELLFNYAKKYAHSRGIDNFRCYVPTHSPLNYAHWRIVSPETKFVKLAECDGFIGQVWTGTARSPMLYNGIRKERTFENAYLEYSSLKNMVRHSGKCLWLLADPIEDNPHYDWDDYRDNYQKTLVASLLHQEVRAFEVMPWPHRVFHGKYPSDAKNAKRISAEYAAELMIINNLLGELAEFSESDYYWETGTRHIGVILSDAMMYQRGSPWKCEIESFHQLALSLLKAGIPVEVVSLDRCLNENYLSPYRILLMSYEGQTPLKREFHDTIKQWVHSGGVLIFFGSKEDPFDLIQAWWITDNLSFKSPREHLFTLLEIDKNSVPGFYECGRGALIYDGASPYDLAQSDRGSDKIQARVKQAIQHIADEDYGYQEQNYIYLHRGPLIIATVMQESIDERALEIPGRLIDIFDSQLPIIDKKVIRPGEQTLLFDLQYMEKVGPKVLLSASRIRDQIIDGRNLSFISRGPIGITCHTLIKLPAMPPDISLRTRDGDTIKADIKWHVDDQILRLVYQNQAQDILVQLFWNKSR